MSNLAELLADCDARGIGLEPTGDGNLAIDAPQDALTPDLMGRLKTHKAELLEALRTPKAADQVGPVRGSPISQAGTPFADWVRRPDCHGRMGWEAPGLPESDRWWARCDFDDLPVVPEDFRLGDIQEPAHHDCAGYVSGGMAEELAAKAARVRRQNQLL